MNENESTVKVSVIVPVYNVATYLRQCMDSIVGQTLREIEILCVDDGSTDESPVILGEYALSDPRVKVLTQKNLSVSAARNNGLAAASGEYVIFWDSDDYFELNALELLYTTAIKRDADLVICNAQDFDDATGMDLGHNYLRKRTQGSERHKNTNAGESVFKHPECYSELPSHLQGIHGRQGSSHRHSLRNRFSQPDLCNACPA